MHAEKKRFSLRLMGLACAALTLAGCEPPPVPAAGGLVPANQPGGLQAAAPISEAADEVQGAYVPPQALPQQAGPAAEPDPRPDVPPTASAPLVANPGLIPVDQANSGGGQTARNGQPAARPAPPTTTRTVSIRLSAGVAVPQSLPTGTMMGMSVDYALGGALNQSSRYVWVISSEGGGDVEAEVQLSTSGTLQSFVPKLRPEDRPFNSRIDEVLPGGKRVRVSNVAPMQTSY